MGQTCDGQLKGPSSASSGQACDTNGITLRCQCTVCSALRTARDLAGHGECGHPRGCTCTLTTGITNNAPAKSKPPPPPSRACSRSDTQHAKHRTFHVPWSPAQPAVPAIPCVPQPGPAELRARPQASGLLPAASGEGAGGGVPRCRPGGRARTVRLSSLNPASTTGQDVPTSTCFVSGVPGAPCRHGNGLRVVVSWWLQIACAADCPVLLKRQHAHGSFARRVHPKLTKSPSCVYLVPPAGSWSSLSCTSPRPPAPAPLRPHPTRPSQPQPAGPSLRHPQPPTTL